MGRRAEAHDDVSRWNNENRLRVSQSVRRCLSASSICLRFTSEISGPEETSTVSSSGEEAMNVTTSSESDALAKSSLVVVVAISASTSIGSETEIPHSSTSFLPVVLPHLSAQSRK